MTDQTRGNSNNKVKVLAMIAVVISAGLLFWLIYSFYNFYNQYNKRTDKITTESYIDKAGLEGVKSKLEERK